MSMVQNTKIVKRYANRKLYDTEISEYVTLGQIVEFVKSGREVQVVENVTKNDITGQTLLAALVETENDVASQTNTLRDILKAGGLSKFVECLKDNAVVEMVDSTSGNVLKQGV